MLTKGLKSSILAVVISAAACLTAFAAPGPFPYELEFNVESCGRICYAGHPNATVLYKDGLAVTPETSFHVVPVVEGPASSSAEDLSVTISLVYENDNLSGSHKETIKQYAPGDLNLTDDYRLFSDNSVQNLAERDKLYSNALTGVELTLASKSDASKKKTIYLYVCSDDDYSEYLMNAPQFEDEPEMDDFEEE
jgi:hypothetical protein